MKRRANYLMTTVMAALLCQVLTVSPLRAAGKPAKESFWKVDELSDSIILDGSGFRMATVFGPTGLSGWILDDKLVVREIDKGSPADGVMLVNDVICSVNGNPLGENPLEVLGGQVVVSEISGTLDLAIIRDGKPVDKTLKLAKLPPLAATWPYDCAKSKQIIANAAKYLAEHQNPDGGFDSSTPIAFALSGLVWLASDDPQYLQNCRRLIAWYDVNDWVHDPDGTFAWGLGYNGIFMGEYCLKTGDRNALKTLQKVSDRIAEVQDPRGGWTHGGPGGYGYVQGGIMNPAGAACWLGLELSEECGLHHKEAIEKARGFFMRFVDNGTLPYGDHHPEFNGSGNSKDALACLALYVKGEQKAAELFGHIVTDFYESRNLGHTGGCLGFMWGNVAGSHNPDRADYRRSLDYWNWLLHVGRRWDGGFHLPPNVTGGTYFYMGPIMNAGAALVYGVPNKSLRIFGRPESVFSEANMSGKLKKDIELYQNLQFDELRKDVSGKTELGKLLLKAADDKERDIALSLQAAKDALAEGNPIKAKTIATTLNGMCDGKVAECKELVTKADGKEYESIVKAATEYENNRWMIYAIPVARRNIEKVASAKGAGIYKKLAEDLLDTSPDASKWQYGAETIFTKYWEDRKSNDVAMAMCKRLANMDFGSWVSWFPMRSLRADGYITDDFTNTWQAVLPCSGLNDGKDAAQFSYHAVTAGESDPPADWMQPGFDDSQWTHAAGPISSAKDSKFKPVPRAECHYIRIPFDASTTDFSEWKLFIERKKERGLTAVVYLNGKCIVWAEPARHQWWPVDMDAATLSHMKKGRNLLAVRLRGDVQEFDIGIYANK